MFGTQMSQPAMVIISVAIMLFMGFAATRLTKLVKLPNVTAYILVGIFIGPYCLNLIPSEIIEGMEFLPDIALAFIAFSVGEFFRLDTLKKNGVKVVLITVMEACMASVLIFAVTYFGFHLSMAFSVVLAALASATAPASTMMTIRQTKAHGDFVDTLLQVVALDDVVSIVLYSIAISIALSQGSAGQTTSRFQVIGKPILINIGVLLLGCLFGVILKFLFHKRSTDNRLIVSIAMIFAFCGICALLDVSPLLGCMSMSTVYINLTDDDKLFKQLNYWSPPLLLLFFVRSGMNFNLSSLVHTAEGGSGSLLFIGITYFLVRIIGKYLGAYLGCLLAKKGPLVRNYLGLALIPQAGVSIGLAALGARTLGGQMGDDLQTIILASSVLYEIVGPACAKLSLYLSKSYSNQLEELVPVEEVKEDGEKKTEVELLIERIQKIQEQLPEHTVSEEEDAYTDAAMEHYEMIHESLRKAAKKGVRSI
jgi:Kef-type K+ transport system membrane component KefB